MSEEKEPREEEISPIENPDVSEEKPSKARIIGCFIMVLLSASVIAAFIGMFGYTIMNMGNAFFKDPSTPIARGPEDGPMGNCVPFNRDNEMMGW